MLGLSGCSYTNIDYQPQVFHISLGLFLLKIIAKRLGREQKNAYI